MVTEPTISCNTEPKFVNPNSGKVVNTVLPAVIWNAQSESDASRQMKKYFESFFVKQVCFEKTINVQLGIHVNKIKLIWI